MRKDFNLQTGSGMDILFKVREDLCDFSFLNHFIVQEFVSRHELFVTEKRLNREKMVWEYVVKSRDAGEYKKMLMDTLYHPPHIEVDPEKSSENNLYLIHHFEGRQLVQEFINNTMMGIEYLWGGPVQMETSEVAAQPGTGDAKPVTAAHRGKEEKKELKWKRVRYTMKEKKLSKATI
jgi:stage V sporulation protein R